jgi:hypothetical protein
MAPQRSDGTPASELCIGADGHIHKRYDYPAKDDVAALEQAQRLSDSDEIEIWIEERFVARVAKDGSSSLVEHPRLRAG